MRRWGRTIGITAGLITLLPLVYAEYRIRRSETLDPVADAPSGAHVEVQGMPIHYEAEGEGDPVVLIHGFGGSTYSWRRNLEAISLARYRAYALDLPGFGYSARTSRPVFTRTAQASIVNDFLRAMGETRPAALIGNSMGAAVALRFALDYPDRTRALVLAAPAVYFRPFLGRAGRVFAMPAIGRLLARAVYYYSLGNEWAGGRMIASAYGSRVDAVTAEMRKAMLRPIRVRGSADAALGLARSRDERPFVGALARVAAPALILAGGRDRAVSLASIERLHASLPDSRMMVLEAAGHLIQEDEPVEFNTSVLNFLRSVEADGS